MVAIMCFGLNLNEMILNFHHDYSDSWWLNNNNNNNGNIINKFENMLKWIYKKLRTVHHYFVIMISC